MMSNLSVKINQLFSMEFGGQQITKRVTLSGNSAELANLVRSDTLQYMYEN